MVNSVFGFNWIGIINQNNVYHDSDSKSICDSSSLSGIQKRLCRRYSQFKPALLSAAKASASSCSHSTCSGIERLPYIGRKSSLKEPSRERAYLQGLSSAQLVTSIYKLYQTGMIETNWDEVMAFVTQFTFSKNQKLKSFSQIDSHNSKVGRFIASQSQRNICKCHGASGSCSVKTCWQTAPMVENVGLLTREKYENSIGIKLNHKNELVPSTITNILAKNSFLYIEN